MAGETPGILSNKSFFLNAAVVLLAVFGALQIHKMNGKEMVRLQDELASQKKKNELRKKILGLESKIERLRPLFPQQDPSDVMLGVSEMARASGLVVNSVRPSGTITQPDYFNHVYVMSVGAKDFHQLGDFISKLENAKEIFVLNELQLNPQANEKYSISVSVARIEMR